MLRILALVGVAGAGLFFATKATAKGNGMGKYRTDFDAIFEKYGKRYGVEPELLKALALAESSLNPDAVNPADPSVGLMQILFRPRIANDPNSPPANRFDVDGWGEATFAKLKNPDFNVKIGAQIIAWNLRTFGSPRGIAVYNAWDQRTMPINGPFKNQAYVDRVIAYYKELSQ